MKNSKLIKHLQTFPPSMEVCILDIKENEYYASKEPSSEGIHASFEIHQMPSNEELKEIKKEFPKAKKFIALSFLNRDREPLSETDIHNMATSIADQCKPCSKEFYSGIYQGVKLTLNAENEKLS